MHQPYSSFRKFCSSAAWPIKLMLTCSFTFVGCAHRPLQESDTVNHSASKQPSETRREGNNDPVLQRVTLETKIGDLQSMISSYEEQARTLLADKQDLLQQKARLENEVADLKALILAHDEQAHSLRADKDDLLRQKARLENEVIDLQTKLADSDSYVALLEKLKLPTNAQLEDGGAQIVAANNSLLDRISEIRQIKRRAPELQALWKALSPFAESHRQFNDARDLAIGAMLVVSAFYDFGNPAPDEALPGCVSVNIQNGLEPVDQLTFAMHMQSDIGCCTDFAMMLGSFLDFLGYEREVAVNSAHQCVRVKINDRWHLLDATTLIFGESYFSGSPWPIYFYTPFPKTRNIPYQHFLLKALAMQIEPYRKSDWEIVPVSENNIAYRAEYLNAPDV